MYYDLAHSHFLNRELEQSKRHACRVLRLQAEHSKALYILGRIKQDEAKRTENQVTAGLVVTAALGLALGAGYLSWVYKVKEISKTVVRTRPSQNAKDLCPIPRSRLPGRVSTRDLKIIP